MAEIGIVEGAVMCRSVFGNKSATVDEKRDREILRRHIVHDLIVGTLEKRRVHGDDRLDPLRGQSSRKRDRMLLGNANIIQAVRKFLFERSQPGSFTHRRRDGHDALVFTSQLDQCIHRNRRVRRPRRFLRRGTGFAHKGRASMKPDRILHRRFVAKPLLRDDMQ